MSSLRTAIGAIGYDLLPFLGRTIWPTSKPRIAPWIFNRNRRDDIFTGSNGEGVTCRWEHTRELYIAKVFPVLSTLLLKRMLRDWPIQFANEPVPHDGTIDVSFVIGHRGTIRLPHLLLTLQSIAAQRDVNVECVVVEQSFEPEIAAALPGWVKYLHTKTPYAEYLYNRSWTLNAGVRHASGRIVILHDNDMLVPEFYASEFMHAASQGGQVFNLKRFITYLDEPSTRSIFGSHSLTGSLRSEAVVQNLCAGGSLGLLRVAYFEIGGMDEEFVGWGGEDTEFWDRCQTLRVANHTYMPIVHLWHPSQPGKAAYRNGSGFGTHTGALYERQMAIPRCERIAALQRRLKP
jgi:hypothetical protein